jgi:GNAT superfamily N-acetyltransferase
VQAARRESPTTLHRAFGAGALLHNLSHEPSACCHHRSVAAAAAGRAARRRRDRRADPRTRRVREADPSAAVTPEKLHPHLFGARPVAEAFVAEVDAEVVGFALFFTNFSTFLAQPGLYLEDLFVRPSHRGRGIGEALLTRLARLAVERDYGRFEWSVLDWNEHAIRFYERMGATVMPTGGSAGSPARRSRRSALEDAGARRAGRRPLRRAARRLSLVGAGALQHRRGLLRTLGA